MAVSRTRWPPPPGTVEEEHRTLRGQLAPIFYTRAGEPMEVPLRFEEVIRKVTGAVCCIGCNHTHVGVPPQVQEVTL
jgi:hypothetical protein